MVKDLTCDKTYKYQQVYAQLKEQILAGNYQPHEKLLSKRKISEQFNVSINSVMVALEQLIMEGYIYSKERRGYFVEDITPFDNEQRQSKLPAHLKEQQRPMHKNYSFSHISTNMHLFAYQDWMKCEQKAFTNFQQDLAHLSHSQGPYEVRQTLAQHLNFKRGVRCEPEQIIFHSSSQDLIAQLLDLFDEPQTIAMENPGYGRYYDLMKLKEWHTELIDVDTQGISMDALKKTDATLAYTTPSHQFPTGVIMPTARRIALLKWAAKAPNRYIIEDDYDSEYKYDIAHLPSLQSLDTFDRVIYSGTFSKTLFPGIRISYIVLPPDLLERYREKFYYRLPSCNALNLYTLHYFIKDGYYQKHITNMNVHFSHVRDTLLQELKKQFKQSISIIDVPAGLHFLARFKTDRSYEEIAASLDTLGIELFPLTRFYLKKAMDTKHPTFVIGFANLQPHEIPLAVKTLKRAIFA